MTLGNIFLKSLIFIQSVNAGKRNISVNEMLGFLQLNVLYTGKYSPPFYFCPLLSLSAKLVNVILVNNISLKHNCMWANSRGDDTVCKCS